MAPCHPHNCVIALFTIALYMPKPNQYCMTNWSSHGCGKGSFLSQFNQLERSVIIVLEGSQSPQWSTLTGKPQSNNKKKHSVHLDYTVTVQSTADMRSLISAFQGYMSLQPHGRMWSCLSSFWVHFP